MKSVNLLAKPSVDLFSHLQSTESYLKEILNAYKPYLEQVLNENVDEFIEELLFAARMHDLGKAAEGFQRFLKERVKWNFRHEVLSLVLLMAAEDNDIEKSDRFFAYAAVLTHHKDINNNKLLDCTGANRPRAVLDVIKRKQEQVTKEIVPHLECIKDYIGVKSLTLENIKNGWEKVRTFHEKLLEWDRGIEHKKSLKLTIARGALLAADHGSSFFQNHGVEPGIFLRTLTEPHHLSSTPRLFQLKAGDREGNLILEAPTGSGKTEAAIRWILRNRKAGERVFYVLPNRASIHAMHETLKKYFGEENVGVVHAKALNYFFNKYAQKQEYQDAHRNASFEKEISKIVHKPIKVLTPHQVVKWFFGLRRFEMGIFELMGGLFIFDEIHAYDPRMLALVIETLKLLNDLGGRCLLMSATFPEFVLSEIKSVVPAIDHISLDESDEEERKLLERTRHKVIFRDCSLEDMLDEMIRHIREKRVLVVANRVKQAQAIYKRIKEKMKGSEDEILLLHSRFIYEDREKKERKIVKALQSGGLDSIRVLVATQVVEVSLDVSFDVMFTEVAPVDDLLQRMGRVNRYGESKEAAEIYVATKYGKHPYEEFYLKKTLETRPPSGTEVNARISSSWMKEAYKSGFCDKDRREFITVRNSFNGIVSELRPMRETLEGNKKYLENLEGIYEVLPLSLSGLFEERLERGEVMKAFNLFVPLHRHSYFDVQRRGLIEPYRDGKSIVSLVYDKELGLLDEPDVFA